MIYIILIWTNQSYWELSELVTIVFLVGVGLQILVDEEAVIDLVTG